MDLASRQDDPERKTMECPHCRAEIPEAAERCPSCAADLEQERHACSRCGEETPDAAFCLACGKLRIEEPCARHPDRKAEGRCVICAVALCGSCRIGDRYAYLCEDHREVAVMEGWAQVYSTANEFEAQLLRDNLRAEGLEAQLFSQKDRIFSVDLGELAIVRLLVPVWRYQRAMEVVRGHLDEEGELVFACPGCGEAYDPGEAVCAHCGASLTPE
jgi:hypothetical protein